jgi:hypothetical protein
MRRMLSYWYCPTDWVVNDSQATYRKKGVLILQSPYPLSLTPHSRKNKTKRQQKQMITLTFDRKIA